MYSVYIFLKKIIYFLNSLYNNYIYLYKFFSLDLFNISISLITLLINPLVDKLISSMSPSYILDVLRNFNYFFYYCYIYIKRYKLFIYLYIYKNI